MPAGSQVLPYRSNIDKIARFVFRDIDSDYPDCADDACDSGHAIVAGTNYGQRSSREHAALAPRSLSPQVVLATSLARIHRQNLINYGVLSLIFCDPDDRDRIDMGATLTLRDLRRAVDEVETMEILVDDRNSITVALSFDDHERAVLLAGGLINWSREKNPD